MGALDLRYHDDGFFGAFLDGLWKSEFFGWPHPTKHGGIDFRWIPPAKLEPAEYGNYRITNPEECATAANAQSEKDFADLLQEVGPLDPIVGWLRPGDLGSSEGIERFVRLAEEHEAELLHQVMTQSKREELPTTE